MSRSALKATLKKGTLRFTTPLFFNDPFDCALTSPTSEHFDELSQKNIHLIHTHRGSSGVLCLTRNQFNLLMWAHYAESHKGGVIGIDTEASGLDCASKNIIPAKFGSVIYSSVRPTAAGIKIPRILNSDACRATLEKIYLSKSIDWAYEEEVRIVRNLENEEHTPTLLEIHHADIPIPKSSIRQIFLGSNFDSSDGDLDAKEIFEQYPHTELNQCYLDNTNWKIKSYDIREALKKGGSGYNY